MLFWPDASVEGQYGLRMLRVVGNDGDRFELSAGLAGGIEDGAYGGGFPGFQALISQRDCRTSAACFRFPDKQGAFSGVRQDKIAIGFFSGAQLP